MNGTSRKVQILADEYQDDAGLWVRITSDGSLLLTQGDDLIVVAIQLWERIATEVMGAVMQLRSEAS